MKAQFHRWYEPGLQRERTRAELERQATQLIRTADRRERHRLSTRIADRKASEPILETPSKWVKLGDLKSAMRKRGGL
jgi:hypothetical protein